MLFFRLDINCIFELSSLIFTDYRVLGAAGEKKNVNSIESANYVDYMTNSKNICR